MKKCVLLVDDEEAILSSLKEYLEEYTDKFTVLTAENGRIATEILLSTPVDLVVTDLKMPEMDGFELLAFISTNFPNTLAIVMTAFASNEARIKLEETGILRLLEKPVNFELLTQEIIRCLNDESNSGTLTGISLPSFLQLIEMEQTTCLMEIIVPDDLHGFLYFKNGIVYDAVFQELRAEEAIYAMLMYDEVRISFKSYTNKNYKKNIRSDLITILMEGATRRDEQKKTSKVKPKTSKAAKSTAKKKSDAVIKNTVTADDSHHLEIVKGDHMPEMNEIIEKLKVVAGFLAAGAFSPNGEMIAEVNSAGINLGELGSIANDVLLKAQKATEMMNVGRGQVVHIEAPKAHVICRCLNEATDFSATAAGKAHVHMVLILDKEEGNIAMGKMKLESIIHELAVFFR